MCRLVEVYGSLLNFREREEMLKKGGIMKEVGKVGRERWKLSFDRFSEGRKEAVLNLVYTENSEDIFYTTVYAVDSLAYKLLMRREMGHQTIRKWQHGREINQTSYRPIQLNSRFGITGMFIIPEEGREHTKRTRTTSRKNYVVIVRKGIKESYRGRQREINLQTLRKAVKESRSRLKPK